MTAIDITALITQLGFPIAVTVYLLWERRQRDNEASKEMVEVVKNNTLIIGQMVEAIKYCKEVNK